MTLIVTLSSIPPRFGKIGPVLESLTAQQGVDEIRLYLPDAYRRFPDWDGTPPPVPTGVTIHRAKRDFGPATKILPAAQDLAARDVNLLFCDDDHIYGDGWARRFLTVRANHPGCVIAQGGWQAEEYAPPGGPRQLTPRATRRWRVTDVEFQLKYAWQDLRNWRIRQHLTAPPRRTFKRSGYIDVFEGYAGVLVRPKMFDAAFHDIPPALWGVDDVWLSGMLTLRGIPIWLDGGILDPRQAESERLAPLTKADVGGSDRHTANRNGVAYFRDVHGIWATGTAA